MKAEAKALTAAAHVTPEKRLEQPFHRRGRNGVTGICDQELELAALGCRSHTHRLVRRAMRERVADQVRRQLSDPRAVAAHGIGYSEIRFNHALRRGRPQFVDDLLEDRFQRVVGIAVQRDASAQPSPREIQHIVDQIRHSADGGMDHVKDATFPLALQRTRPLKDMSAGADRRQRIAKVMAQHGYELLAQFRGLALAGKSFLKLRSRIHQLALIASPVGRFDHYQRGEQDAAIAITALGRIGDYRQAPAVSRLEIQRELVEEALHAQ